jgi:hypothetical protein
MKVKTHKWLQSQMTMKMIWLDLILQRDTGKDYSLLGYDAMWFKTLVANPEAGGKNLSRNLGTCRSVYMSSYSINT